MGVGIGEIRRTLASAGEAYEAIAPLAAKDGERSWAVSGALAKLAPEVAELVREWLKRDGELARYRDAWAQRPRAGSWGIRRAYARRRVRRALKRTTSPRLLAELVDAGVAPALLEVREELRRIGGLTPLRDRALRVAAAHALHPASIDHHACHEGGLLEHKVSVLREAIRLVKAGEVPDEDLDAFLTAAVMHDEGKCRAFKKSGGTWKRMDGLHAQHTARMLRSFPELDAEHGRDAQRLLLALAHEHDRENVPDDYRASVGRLQRLIHRCDASAVAQEGTVSTITLELAADRALEALPRMIQELSINGIGGAVGGKGTGGKKLTHGLYEKATERGEEMLLLLEASVRDQLQGFVDKETQRALSLWTRRTKGLHSGAAAIFKVMAQAGALPGSVRGIPISPDEPLVSLRSGDVPFFAAFPVSLAWLSDRLGPGEVDRLRKEWGTRGFELRDMVAGTSLEAPEEGPRTETGAPAADATSQEEAPYGWCTACNRKLVVHQGMDAVACPNYFTSKCRVRMPLKDGKPDPSCSVCGTPRRIVRPRDPAQKPFLGCPKRCKPPAPGGAAATVIPGNDGPGGPRGPKGDDGGETAEEES